MAITTLSMVLTVFVLNLHHVTDRPVPTWAKIIIFKYMSRVMCMCHIEKQYSLALRTRRRSSHLLRNEAYPHQDNNVYRFRPPENPEVESEGTRTPMLELKRRTLNTNNENNVNKQSSCGKSKYPHSSVSTVTQEHGVLEPEDNAKDWRNMAEVFDRLFFWLFLLAILITTLVLFHPLISASAQIPLL